MHLQFCSAVLKAPAAMAVLCLGVGLAAYVGLRNFARIVFALSRSRSQLFSVGAGMTLLVIVFQMHHWGRTQPAGANGEDLIAAAEPFAASGVAIVEESPIGRG